ncbi:MAG TPA: sugar ABC transporter ATP-binding protein [Thermoleophilaceae bacterium]
MLQPAADQSAETDRTSAPDPQVALRVTDAAKAFGATQALSSASIEVRAGEIHAVVGENGSGKSTLVKLLAGVHRPDRGRIAIAGVPVDQLASPKESLRAGIATVFQEVLVVEPRSVLENVWIGTDGLFRDRLSAAAKRERAGAILGELLAKPPPLDLPAEALSLSDRQACCIARALVRVPRILILDEATSALDVATRDRLFAILRRLAGEGVGVIFISHRMDEIAEVGDRCTVMRSGETVATLERGDAGSEQLVRLMTGDEHLAPAAAREQVARREPGQTLFSHGGLDVGSGELIGLAGLEGHGQDEFLRELWRAGAAAGLRAAYVPRERRAEGLFESKSVRENFGLPTFRQDVRHGLLSHARTRARLAGYAERLRIRMHDPEDGITTLSGGNQQKIVMARWLATDPELLLLNDPTRGVDLGAKRDLYGLLAELTAHGVAIVMLSSELDEHVELMDRVEVFREHALFCELDRTRLSRQALVSAFFGERPDA